MKDISAVIPCYNVEEYIADCLDSLIEQSYKLLEIICIDDGSSDETVAILRRYEQNYPDRLIVLKNATNIGASASRNKGLRLARGDYIQFLDADDLLLPNKLMHQVDVLARHSDPVLLVGSYLKKGVDGQTIPNAAGHLEPWHGLVIGELGITSANLWPRKAVLAIDGWNESLRSSQEYDLMFRLMATNISVVFDSEFLTIIRERVSGAISQKDPSGNARRFIDLRLQMLRHVQDACANDTIRHAALQRIFEVIRVLYEYDSEAAKRLYKENIQGRYSPRLSGVVSRKYLLLYRLFGFELAEKIRSAISRGA